MNFLRSLAASVVIALVVSASWADEPAPLKVRFGDLGASVNNLYQLLAIKKGIYRKYGIDLQIVDFLQGGPEEVAAAVGGQIDMGSVGTPVLSAISRGLPVRVVGSPPRKGQPFILVGLPENTDISQLKGRTLGFSSMGGGSLQALYYILKAHRIFPGDVKAIAFGAGPNGYLALKSGKLAAVVLVEPYASKAEIDGVGRILADADTYFAHYQHSYVFATKRFIRDHPEAIRTYFQASREAVRYAQSHLDELIAYGVKTLALDEAVLRVALAKTIGKWDDSFAVDTEGLLTAVKIVQDLGDIGKSYTPDINQIVEPGFLSP